MNKLRIIIVDDEEASLFGLQKLIPWSELGYELTGVFSCGDDAIDFIAHNHVDIVCTDIAMPKPDGLDIANICSEEYPHIKILLFSAFRDFEYAQRALRFKNVCDYLTKPIDYKLFISTLKNLAESADSKSSEFSSVEDMDNRLSFFSNLLCGNISNEDDLTQKMESLDINIEPNAAICDLIMFHIRDFQDFLKKTSKYTPVQLYYAISNFYPFYRKNSYFSLALYSFSNIMWIVMHRQDAPDTKEITEKFVSEITENFHSVLGIDVDVSYNQKSSSILTFLGKHDEQISDITDSSNSDVIAQAIDYINKNLDKNISLEDVAQHVFMCPAYFSSYFKKKTGERFIEHLTAIRMKRAATLLLSNENISLNDICDMIGYNHIGYFHRKFKSYYGVTPTEYRKQNKM